MKKLFIGAILSIFTVFTFQTIMAQSKENSKDETMKLSFENIKTGELPSNWTIEATNQKGPLATWKVIEDETAVSGNKVLALTAPNHDFGGTFNLCWTKDADFLNGEITVMVKANTGIEDQGGGVIWRAQDKGDYYISRYNPLENNFRIYYVKEEARKILASARVKLPAGKWFELKIEQNGEHISGYLNGKKLLEVDDHTFSKPGGIGLWTKADAVTSFDDFTVKTNR